MMTPNDAAADINDAAYLVRRIDEIGRFLQQRETDARLNHIFLDCYVMTELVRQSIMLLQANAGDERLLSDLNSTLFAAEVLLQYMVRILPMPVIDASIDALTDKIGKCEVCRVDG